MEGYRMNGEIKNLQVIEDSSDHMLQYRAIQKSNDIDNRLDYDHSRIERLSGPYVSDKVVR